MQAKLILTRCASLVGVLTLLLGAVASLIPFQATTQTSSDERTLQIEAVPVFQMESDDGLPGSTSNCTLVELYPGYPGYRGNITGVMPHWGGIGDYECLQTLEQVDPTFDRAQEDQANTQVARAIGVNGTFEDWTWENWMLIEDGRGLPMSCYTCLMYDTTSSPLNPDVRPAIDDPRILLGFPGERTATDRISQELLGENLLSDQDDYEIRAEAYFQLGASANAPELLAGMIDRISEARRPGAPYYTYQDATDVILSRGGYTVTSETMSPDDQVFSAYYAFFVGIKYVDPLVSDSYINNFTAVLDGWRLSGFRGSLRDYLQENWQP
jgi:hypothetical protein